MIYSCISLGNVAVNFVLSSPPSLSVVCLFFSLMSADLIKVNTFMLPSITDQLYLSKKKVLKEQTKEAFIEAVIYHQCL